MIKEGGKLREKAFDQIYATEFPKIKAFILSRSGSVDDAHDVFQNVLEKFVLYIRSGGELKSIGGYLYSNARNAWIDEKRREKRKHNYEAEEALDISPKELQPEMESVKELLRTLFERIGEKCRRLLERRYFDEWTMATIAENENYSSAESTRVSVKRCIDSLRKVIHDADLDWNMMK
ncbi:MAG: sigma-70 family RNA polymerase sigma factor [Bacteroidota bacterium]